MSSSTPAAGALSPAFFSRGVGLGLGEGSACAGTAKAKMNKNARIDLTLNVLIQPIYTEIMELSKTFDTSLTPGWYVKNFPKTLDK
jgi:hypothetical protein